MFISMKIRRCGYRNLRILHRRLLLLVYDSLCKSNIDNAAFEVERYGLHQVFESNFSGVAQILVSPQDSSASKIDIVVSSAIESFPVDVKVYLRSKGNSAKDESKVDLTCKGKVFVVQEHS
jgi:hypothetical protein